MGRRSQKRGGENLHRHAREHACARARAHTHAHAHTHTHTPQSVNRVLVTGRWTNGGSGGMGEGLKGAIEGEQGGGGGWRRGGGGSESGGREWRQDVGRLPPDDLHQSTTVH